MANDIDIGCSINNEPIYDLDNFPVLGTEERNYIKSIYVDNQLKDIDFSEYKNRFILIQQGATGSGTIPFYINYGTSNVKILTEGNNEINGLRLLYVTNMNIIDPFTNTIISNNLIFTNCRNGTSNINSYIFILKYKSEF